MTILTALFSQCYGICYGRLIKKFKIKKKLRRFLK
jgi:hypothetical protein